MVPGTVELGRTHVLTHGRPGGSREPVIGRPLRVRTERSDLALAIAVLQHCAGEDEAGYHEPAENGEDESPRRAEQGIKEAPDHDEEHREHEKTHAAMIAGRCDAAGGSNDRCYAVSPTAPAACSAADGAGRRWRRGACDDRPRSPRSSPRTRRLRPRPRRQGRGSRCGRGTSGRG